MTEDEICRMYRLSAYPVRQVRILAELTGMDRAEVLRILHGRALQCLKNRGDEANGK